MEKIMEVYHQLFPHITYADWVFCLLGLALHCLMKIKHINWYDFNILRFVRDFLPVWIYSVVTIILCLGTLPVYLAGYSVFDSALIGYTAGSLFRNLLKQRSDQLKVKSDKL